MFDKLCGHPMIITLYAKLKQDHTLIEIYDKLNEQQFSGQNLDGIGL